MEYKPVEFDYLGESIHTALRKLCDSDMTSLLYNVISLCGEGWTDFLLLATTELNSVEPQTAKDAGPCILRASQILRTGCAERNALKIAFRMCSNEERAEMCEYLFD